MLYIALSALAVSIMLVGANLLIQRQRFSDAMNSLTTFLQSQFETVSSNTNSNQGNTVSIPPQLNCGGTAVAGTSNCLLLGRLIVFNPKMNFKSGAGASSQASGPWQITSYYLVATKDAENANNYYQGGATCQANFVNCGDDKTAVKKATIYAIASGATPFNIPWDASITQTWKWINPDTAQPTQWDNTTGAQLAIIRSPISSSILTYQLNIDIGNLTLPTPQPVKINDPNNSVLPEPNQIGLLLVGNQDIGYNGGAICLSGGSTSAAIKSKIPINFGDAGPQTSGQIKSILTDTEKGCGL
jgi:hypothetical protein